MRVLSKIIYIIKLLLFAVNFYFVYLMVPNILDTNLFGIVFLIIYLFLSVKVLTELIGNSVKYKEDIIYNMMQVGVYSYLLVISIKTTMANLYVTRITLNYFRTNFIILSVLMLFVLLYSFIELRSSD